MYICIFMFKVFVYIYMYILYIYVHILGALTWWDMCDMTHPRVERAPFLCGTWLVLVYTLTHSCVTWLINACVMTYWYVWHDSFLYVVCIVYMQVLLIFKAMPWYHAGRASFWRVTRRIVLCARTRCHVRLDSFMCAMTHRCMRHDLLICVIWLIHICDMTHCFAGSAHFWSAACVCHDSLSCAPWLIYVCHDSLMYATRLIDVQVLLIFGALPWWGEFRKLPVYRY